METEKTKEVIKNFGKYLNGQYSNTKSLTTESIKIGELLKSIGVDKETLENEEACFNILKKCILAYGKKMGKPYHKKNLKLS